MQRNQNTKTYNHNRRIGNNNGRTEMNNKKIDNRRRENVNDKNTYEKTNSFPLGEICSKHEKTNTVESPYVHRYTAYLKDLESNWAYDQSGRKPKPTYANVSK